MPRTWFAVAVGLSFVNGAFGAEGDICYLSGTKSTIVNDRLYFLGGNYSTITAGGQDVQVEPSPSLYHLTLNSSHPSPSKHPSHPPSSTQPQSPPKHSRTKAPQTQTAATPTAPCGHSTTRSTRSAGVLQPILHSSEPDLALQHHNKTMDRRRRLRWRSEHRPPRIRLLRKRPRSTPAGGQSPHMGGLIRFDASDPNNLSWTNDTLTNGSYGVDVTNLHGAAMVYIPAAEAGMLVVVGGYMPLPTSRTQLAHIQPNCQITITATLAQNANPPIEADWQIGARPAPRLPTASPSALQGVLSTAPDGSAFHITAYGGWSRRDGRSYEDVHVLAIPAFEWIDASDVARVTNGEMDEGGDREIGRDALGNGGAWGDVHSGGRYVENGACGGSVSGDGDGEGDEDGEVYHPLRVARQFGYHTSATYEVSPVIYRDIGGDSTGGATKTIPAAGFADPTLASILQLRVSGSSAPSSPSDDPTSDAPDGESGTNTGAIAGVVVGGVAGLAAILALVWFVLRRKRKHLQQVSSGVAGGDVSPPVQDGTKTVQDKDKTDMPGLQGVPVVEMEAPVHSMRAELQDGGVSNRHELP
ncbi:uncharacterized protein DSM5745_07840 [Aspergillus mulundensis]|uniref:Uncharacterized protein n=1 Tax=Aspergillus mulundensis TaxID=1810919 RepID=A0A3D8RFE9_9EURO|nr:hypothetical protein DSM5745_07840 [Aspergillus mulundensis]RDW72668.1 hypothetical protein DSM5745_07840 [Aspergillus mulundensis]